MDDRPRPLSVASKRLFLALWPAPATRAALAAESARWRWPAGARVVPAPSLHLTLHYIGPLPVQRVEAVANALGVRCERFTLRLDRRECWRNRCAVLGSAVTPPALAALHAALAQALRALELPVELRAFRPHVTLAREAAQAVPPDDGDAVVWRVAGYALVHSEGGRYTPLARYACG